jgi:hypothetical protein
MPKVSKSSAPGLVLKDAPSNPAVKRWQNVNVGGVADPAGAPVPPLTVWEEEAHEALGEWLLGLNVPSEHIVDMTVTEAPLSVLVFVEMDSREHAEQFANGFRFSDLASEAAVTHAGNGVQFNMPKAGLDDDWLACDTCGKPVTGDDMLAHGGNCSSCAAVEAAAAKEEPVYAMLAARETNSDRHGEFAQHKDVKVRRALASNPHLGSFGFDTLLRDTDIEVRLRLASLPGLLPNGLHELAKDPHMGVRQQVAAHPSRMDYRTQELLLSDSVSVRNELAGRPDLTVTVANQLARDESDTVKATFFSNPKTSDEHVSYGAAYETGIARDAARDEQRRRANRQALG